MSPCGLVPTVIETLQKTHDPNIHQKHFTICSRLLAWKGIHLSLQAFNQCKDLNVGLHIFGSGPEKQKLQALATNLGIDDRVTFHGHVSRQKLLEWLPSSIALLHPSLQESGGMACLEALAARVPVICLNHGGPPMLVSGDAGFVISPESPEQVIKEMSEKMRLLASNPEIHVAMGKRGQEKAINSHTWTVKLNAIYERFNTTQLKR
ncbi:MAG: glycosyltransferase [Cyanothece sp. SIO1E1]|nr:glycosyltransferase [Cyanothece sp. SIO1E1]